MKHTDQEGNIAAVYKFGKTIVKIDTSYVVKDEEERERVERGIALAAWAIVDELIERGEDV